MDKRIGAQFYTLRDFTQTIEEFDKTCKKISDIGYKIVQVSGTPLDAKEMRDVLDKYGLTAVTTHKGYDDFVKNIDKVIEYNKILGSDLCGLGAMSPDCWGSKEGMDGFISTINKVCEILKKENMYFGYHNHAFEFIKHDGKLSYDRLIEETDPETFNFIADTYWFQMGGKNPADVIKKLGKRAMAVHLKDFYVKKESWMEPNVCEVGSGNLDWTAILDACEEAGTRWALVEQDICLRDPFDCMKISYDFLAERGYN